MNLETRINKFVVSDPNVCIGCATCMAACYQSAYDRGKLATPRLIVTRSSSGTMPNQCRQCDDAPCANVCPVGALRFGENNYIEVYEDLCIVRLLAPSVRYKQKQKKCLQSITI